MPPKKSPSSDDPTPTGAEVATDADGKPIPTGEGGPSPEGEGEGATGPVEGEGQDDPLANVTFEQIQERYGEDLEKLGQARWEDGRRKGQGDSDTAHQKRMREQDASREAVKVFNELSAKADSQDPDQRDEFTAAMRDPRVKRLYDQGEQAAQAPTVEEVVGQATSNVIVEVQDFILKQPEMKDLTADERARIDKDRKGADGQAHFTTLGGIVSEQMALWREKVKAAAKGSTSQAEIDAAVKVANEELLNKLGIEPSLVEGKSPSGKRPTRAQLRAMTVEQASQYSEELLDDVTKNGP